LIFAPGEVSIASVVDVEEKGGRGDGGRKGIGWILYFIFVI
jgi:hypothetical protein